MKTLARWLAALVLCAAAGMACAQQIGWEYKNGNAKDIGAGADGSIWVISSGGVGGGNYKIYRLVNGTWVQAPGGGVRIDVGPHGDPWMIDYAHNIYHWNAGRSDWDKLDGQGLDIGVGANGDVWLIGTDQSIWKLEPAGWQKKPGQGLRIDVDQHGVPWIVNSSNAILRWNGNGWENIPGGAKDIGIGSEGSVWIVGTDGSVWKYNGNKGWTKTDGNLVNITVDNQGNPWGVNNSDQIWGATKGATLGVAVAPTPAMLRPPRKFLGAGEYLGPSEIVQSADGKTYATMQSDGNLCTYTGTPTARGPALWCHNRLGSGGQFVTVMQGDGNLCTYRGTSAASFVSGATWCSNAVAPGGQFFLVQQNDGNLCVHKGTSPSDDHGSLWCRFSEKPPVTLGDTSGGMELLDNQSDKFVWFTVYGNQILGAGCIPPGKAVYVQTNNVDHVRAEVMQYVGCAQPKVCDLSVSGVNLRYWQGEGLGVTPFKSCTEGFG